MARTGILGRGLDLLEDRLGVQMMPRESAERMEEMAYQLEVFREEASELAYHALDYFSGRPHEMRAEHRKRLAQRSRVALIKDPLAGAHADLLSNFAFGRGIGKPRAEQETVQEVIDEFWSDPVNEDKLFSFEGQRHRSNELLSQANLFVTLFEKNGHLRIGFLDADIVTDVVTDPDDEERPLYYVARKRRTDWDYDQHRVKTTDEMAGGFPKVIYYEHWRNVEDLNRELREEGKQPYRGPKKDDLAEGLIYHVRINRIGRTQFGTPPFARTLRFFSAMNVLTESHVAMAQAASTLIAKRVQKGSPKTIVDSANAILSQTGELGAARFGEPLSGLETSPSQLPPSPGSFWLENQSDTFEPLNMNSGAAQMVATAQVVRAPISAAAQFGQHYLGDASNANLATATTLELPALMNVGAWQETFEALIRFLVDRKIEAAARAGRFGGYDADLSEALSPKPISELRMAEAEDRAELERRTNTDLSYSFEMPYPGRRNLPDVTAAVTATLQALPGGSLNEPLVKEALTFLFTHGYQLEDPPKVVEEVMKAHKTILEKLAQQQQAQLDAQNQPPPGEGNGKPADEKSQYGEKRRGTPPGREMASTQAGLEEDDVLTLVEGTDVLYDMVMGPLLKSFEPPSPAHDGNGSGP